MWAFRTWSQGALGLGICVGIMAGASQRPTGWAVAPAPPVPSASSPPSASTGGSPAKASGLMREGTRLLDQPAVCLSSGERLLVTIDENSPPLIALENLAAQRILKAVLDDASDDHWIVGGQITEFQERNYVLLDRVIRQSKARVD